MPLVRPLVISVLTIVLLKGKFELVHIIYKIVVRLIEPSKV